MAIAANKSNRIKISPSDRLYLGIVYAFLALFVTLVLYPIIYVLSCSFSSPTALIEGRVILWPVDPGLQGYKAILKEQSVWTGFYNSVVYTVTSTVLATAVTFLGGYVLSRREFPARNALMTFFMVTMFIGGGTIPTYLLISNLGLIDSMWALVLPGMFSIWNATVARTFIRSTIPEDLYEAMSIDGGDYFKFLFRVVLPLSAPILAVLALNNALGMWNSYYGAMLYFNDSSKYPLQLVLRKILLSTKVDIDDMSQMAASAMDAMDNMYMAELMKYSVIVVGSLPLMIAYPFLQKYFVKGMMIGSLKG